MKSQKLAECLEEQKKAGFLPLARIVKGLAPKTKYDTNFTNALKKALPEGSLKTIQIKVWAANRLIFFRATPENLETIKEVCREVKRKRQAKKRLLTSKQLVGILKEKYDLLFSSDTLAEYARKGKIPSVVKTGPRRLFRPKNIEKIKRAILVEMQKRGR